MDPRSCLLRADQAVSDLDFDEVNKALNEYWAWRFRGGFEPDMSDQSDRYKKGDEFAKWVEGRIR